jgi:hypothetical protein
MTTPPRLAAWLLEAILAASDCDAVAGDLWEEFNTHVVPRRGVVTARWWYRWQVARSLAPLFFRSWEKAPLARAAGALIAAATAGTVPATALILLRSFVLQQVPLKATAEPSLAFIVTLAVVVVCAGVGGLAVAGRVLGAQPRHR